MSDRTLGGVTASVKAVRLALHLIKGAALVGMAFPHLKPVERDAVISRWCRDALAILRIQVHVRSHPSPRTAAPVLFLANHVSWLDILALNAVRRVRFVAKTEIQAWPVLGWLAARTGTFFIQRSRPRQLIRLIRSMSQTLDQGRCIGLFPEGTTTDGRQVLPFRSGLVQSAVASRTVVWPVAIRYTTPDGAQASSAAFVGDQSFLQSIRLVLAEPDTHLHLWFAEPLDGGSTGRKQLAGQAWTAVSAMITDPQRTFAPMPQLIHAPIHWPNEPRTAA